MGLTPEEAHCAVRFSLGAGNTAEEIDYVLNALRELLTETRGTGILNALLIGYMPHAGEIAGRPNGVLVSDTGHAGMWTGGMVDMTHAGQKYIRCAGSLGWGFPGSLGVKCALPDRPVVCFAGDGL